MYIYIGGSDSRIMLMLVIHTIDHTFTHRNRIHIIQYYLKYGVSNIYINVGTHIIVNLN